MTLIRNVLWHGPESSVEYSRLMSSPSGYMIDGQVIMLLDGGPATVHYFVRCGHDWSTKAAEVRLMRGLATDRVAIRSDQAGTWWVNNTPDPATPGRPFEELHDLVDVDLAFTPATNTLPIRRLGLAVGESRECDAVWLRFPELVPERLQQRYTRIESREYLYESSDGAFRARLEVDEEGVVVRYGDQWYRVNS